MSTTGESIQYTIYINLQGGGVGIDSSINISCTAEQDAYVLALASAIEGVALPTGVTPYFQVTKNDATTISYSASGTPLAFS